MASQARLDLEEALHLVDKMDECFLKMVPTEQAISAAADRRQTDEELQAEAAENAKAFFDSASKLDDHLHTFEAAPPQLSTIQKLKQEIDELQEELREKDGLIQECRAKVEKWKGVLEQSKTMQSQCLFKEFQQ